MAHEQAKALVGLGHDVRVFAGELGSSRSRHGRADDIHEGIRVHRVATIPEDYSPEFLNFLHPAVDDHFREVLQDFRPEIVHCHNLMGLSVKLPILAKQHGAKTVCTLHDFWGFCLRNTAVRSDGRPCDNVTQCRSCLPRIHDGRKLHVPLRFRKDFVRLALDNVDRFIAPSRYIADRYMWAGLSEDRLTIIANGIDIDRFYPSAEAPFRDKILITYVGYFGVHKGVATLLDALAILPKSRTPFALQLVGEGPEREAYLAQIEALGLHDRVSFLGKVPSPSMPGVYAQSDIVVLPSVWDENQPVVLMEAMAAGLPVIASRKGGIPELIDHGVNGLMFIAGDPQDLAAQLTKLIEDPGLRQVVGRRGRQRVEGGSHDGQARRLIKVYAEITGLSQGLVCPQNLYVATGSLRRKTVDEGTSLSDEKYPFRHFMPLEWIVDCMPAFSGVMLTGWLWSAIRLLGVDAIISLPESFRRSRNFIRWRTGRPPFYGQRNSDWAEKCSPPDRLS